MIPVRLPGAAAPQCPGLVGAGAAPRGRGRRAGCGGVRGAQRGAVRDRVRRSTPSDPPEGELWLFSGRYCPPSYRN